MKYIKTFEEVQTGSKHDYSNMNLSVLPELPKGLIKLFCDNNQLSVLPELPKGLTYLNCRHNQLPYNNLTEYKQWIIDNEKLIDKYGWIEAHKISNKMKKYNIL